MIAISIPQVRMEKKKRNVIIAKLIFLRVLPEEQTIWIDIHSAALLTTELFYPLNKDA